MYGCYECICDSITNKWATISTIWLPLLCIGVCIVDLKSIKYRTYRYVLMLFLIISSCIVIGKNVSVLADSCNLVTKNEEQDYAKYVNDLKEKIPGDKLDRVIAYNVLAKFYIMSDIKPCYKIGSVVMIVK